MAEIGLHTLLVRVADAGLDLQRDDGSFPPGHNGPWGHRETPLRNSGHWLITLARAHELSREVRFRQATEHALDYLMRLEHRPHGFAFLHNRDDRIPNSNTLIGQAWTLEALLVGFEHVGVSAALELAQEVFELHRFDHALGLWHSLEVDGAQLGPDLTLNHQIWFGAMADRLGHHGSATAAAQADRVRQTLSTRIQFAGDGLIRHMLSDRQSLAAQPRRILGEIRNRTLARSHIRRLRSGYHAFNLAGLARLFERSPMQSEALIRAIDRAIKVLDSGPALAQVEASPFGFGYNPVGFEMALALERLPHSSGADPQSWVQRQIDRTLNPNNWLLERTVSDRNTLAARFYEATALANYSVQIDP